MRRRAALGSPLGAPSICLTLAALLAAAGCTPPAAVRRYSASATLVTARLPETTTALAASCRRSQSYRLRRTSDAWYGADSLGAACAGRDRALREVSAMNRVLASYFAALAVLSGEKVADLDARVSALGNAIGDAGEFSHAKVGAVEALAKFTASHAAGGYQRGALREAIAAQNANVQTVTIALHDILADDFVRYLRDDEMAQVTFYRSALSEHSDREPLGAILIRDSYDDRQAELTQRIDAVETLSQAMLTVGRGHQRLYDARNHLGAKELLAAVVSMGRELDAAVAKIDRAF